MSNRVLRPAFLLTFALGPAACGKPASSGHPDEPILIGNPPEPEPEPVRPEPDAQALELVLDKRTVREPLPAWERPKHPKPYGGRVINPTLDGKLVYAAHDGSCYVRAAPPAGAPPRPPGDDGSRAKPVSCPSEMLEPAWDTCLAGSLSVLPDGECVCLRTGNPPPPPAAAECPSTAKPQH
jgi:hypothetical protein